MDTEGTFAPATVEAAQERYEQLGPTAQTVVKAVAKAMEMDSAEYDERVTGAVVETAREVLFAADLQVRVGSRDEYDDWVADNPEYATTVVGSEHVDRVAWHAAPALDQAVAATFQDERRAAVGTLRRQAFGRLYRPVFAD